MDGLVKLVGDNVRELRILKGLTREAFAEKCNLEISYLARIERGEKNITLQTLEKIAHGLEESPSTILLFNEISNPEQYFRNDELLKILNGRLINRSETEIKMVLNVVDEILKVLDT